MFLVRYDDVDLSGFSPEDYQKMIIDFNRWREALKEKARLVNSGKLKDGDGKTLRLKEGRVVVDGPYCETKEAMAGYFLIEAGNYDQAVEYAGECPILPLGGSLEVRELETHVADPALH